MIERPFTVEAHGLTLHSVLFQILKAETASAVAATLERNPGLATDGPFLRLGRTVIRPLGLTP